MQFKQEKANKNIDNKAKDLYLKNAFANKENIAQLCNQIDNTSPIYLNASKN